MNTAPTDTIVDPAQDPAYGRTADAWVHLMRTLRTALPETPDAAEEAIACRDNAAIEAVTAFCPVSAAEALLAADYVAARAQAMDCLRLANAATAAGKPAEARRYRADAARQMRAGHSAVERLLRVQARRAKREADPRATSSAAWTAHCAGQMMASAVPGREGAPPWAKPAGTPATDAMPTDAPAPPAEHADAPRTVMPERDPGTPAGTGEGRAHEPPAWCGTDARVIPGASPGTGSGHDEKENAGARSGHDAEERAGRDEEQSADAEADLAADAALYAILYPERAALIRRHGGVPADVTFGPPEEDLVRALLAMPA
jgi:hypothetical protein